MNWEPGDKFCELSPLRDVTLTFDIFQVDATHCLQLWYHAPANVVYHIKWKELQTDTHRHTHKHTQPSQCDTENIAVPTASQLTHTQCHSTYTVNCQLTGVTAMLFDMFDSVANPGFTEHCDHTDCSINPAGGTGIYGLLSSTGTTSTALATPPFDVSCGVAMDRKSFFCNQTHSRSTGMQ